jgi:hypothetical protein
MTKVELPYCTVFIVVAALICHVLVLVGNLETANTLHLLGESTSGWSDVGLSLGSSLSHELDHLLDHTVTQLTGSLESTIKVQTSIDYVLRAVANATDSAASTLETSAVASPIAASSELSLLEAVGPKLVAPHTRPSDIEGGEEEVASLLQSSASVCQESADSTCGSSSDELASLLQGKVHMQLAGAEADTKPETEKTHKQSAQKKRIKALKDTRATLHAHIGHLVGKVKIAVHELLVLLRPALVQIGKWLSSMGPKMQGTIEEFSIVIDRVQQIIDGIMARIAGPGPPNEVLLHHVFHVFDTDESGSVNQTDITKTSILYGITALQHLKGEQLLRKYDSNNDKKLSKQEFSLMLGDSSIPKVSSVILRTFARKLSEVAGGLVKAQQRDEIADSVVKYFNLVAAKNTTKVSWVVQALTRESLPIEFVADVLVQLAYNAENPGIPAVVDVASIIVGEMVRQDRKVLSKALEKIGDPKWWHEAGFDPLGQTKIHKQVLKWVRSAGGASQLLQLTAGNVAAGVDMAAVAHASVLKRSRKYAAEKNAIRAADLDAMMSSDTLVSLFQGLLGSEALASGMDPDVTRVVKAAAKAHPETLRFAKWLAKNASNTATHLQHLCFDHAHTSSNAVDSLASQIQGMLKKTQNFLRLMQRYSTPHGMLALEARVNKFAEHGLREVLSIVDKKINASLAKTGKPMLVQEEYTRAGLWKEVIKLNNDLKAVLPVVIDDIKFAKKEVSAVASNILSTFPVLKLKGPANLENFKSLYATMWIIYFVTFVLLTIGILFYAFWSSGYFRSSQTTDEVVAPSCFAERCSICSRACTACFVPCFGTASDTDMFFWSAMLLATVVLVVMFLLSTLLALASGLKSWVSSGCDEVYLLNDNTICVEAMKGIQYWLSTFWHAERFKHPMESMCTSRSLMTCGIISDKLKQSAVFTTLGSMLAMVLTCQLVFESARTYETERWRRIVKEFKDDD